MLVPCFWKAILFGVVRLGNEQLWPSRNNDLLRLLPLLKITERCRNLCAPGTELGTPDHHTRHWVPVCLLHVLHGTCLRSSAQAHRTGIGRAPVTATFLPFHCPTPPCTGHCNKSHSEEAVKQYSRA
ncbi:unnamed protein product [Discosporangium mesarthrocarpum]